jgi:hypothetical protein
MHLPVDLVILIHEAREMRVAHLQFVDALGMFGKVRGKLVRGVGHRFLLLLRQPAPGAFRAP